MKSLVAILAFALLAPASPQNSNIIAIILTGQRTLVRLHSDGTTQPIDAAKDIETIDHVAADGAIIANTLARVLKIPIDSGPVKVLLEHPPRMRFATIAPDGKQLAFSWNVTDDSGVYLATRRTDGDFAEPRLISRGYGPSFSSDGKFIYFEKQGLWRCELATQTTERFLPKFDAAHTVRCSRDGRFIAFSMDRALYVYTVKDESVRKLTRGDSYDRFPSFAGDEIFFFRETRAGKRQVIARRIDGSDDERIVYEGDVELVCAIEQK